MIIGDGGLDCGWRAGIRLGGTRERTAVDGQMHVARNVAVQLEIERGFFILIARNPLKSNDSKNKR
jgi:hypothetical protein